jgi:DNA-binding NarL/FixJ family response regulator
VVEGSSGSRTTALAPVSPGRATPVAPVPASMDSLTRRQFEVARLIARGLSNEEIAQDLVLTPGTAGNHVGHILRRLGARNRAQVATWVMQVASGGAAGGSLAS